jgi:UDP-2,4-diacetamido-2,4,6-trideoxy-beta-L-altropyranose hydrolase
VVDHYGLDARWEDKLRGAARQIMAIDDKADRPHACDLLLDQNLNAEPQARYRDLVPQKTRFLFGPQYALLRSEFSAWRDREPEVRPLASRVLVTLGGSEQQQVLATVKEGLKQFEIRIASGTERMPELMAGCDMALSGGGVTALELAFMGVPSLLVELSADQRPGITGLEAAGLCIDLGKGAALTASRVAEAASALASDIARRTRMSRGLRLLVDGRGAERVAEALA